MSFVVFCSTVNAEVIDTPQSLNVTQVSSIYNSQISNDELNATFNFVTNNGITEKDSSSTRSLGYNPNSTLTVKHNYFITATNNSVLIPKGNEVDFKIERFPFAIKHKSGNDSNFIYKTIPTQIRLLLYFTDGSMQYVDEVTFTNTSNVYLSNITCSFEPKKDVNKIEIITATTVPFGTVTIYQGESDGSQEGFYLTVDQHTKSEGLLGGLLEWVKNLFNKVTEGFSALGDGINNLWNSIKELPAKIWEFISEGLKSLFVPSDEFILDFKDDMSVMLEEKLGAVYQVTNILFDFWGRITDSDTQNTIDIPLVSIDLPQGNTFSFGGWSVPIIPQGFDFLADICKLFAGIICTWAFINGLRKRYDEVMGVEQ